MRCATVIMPAQSVTEGRTCRTYPSLPLPAVTRSRFGSPFGAPPPIGGRPRPQRLQIYCFHLAVERAAAGPRAPLTSQRLTGVAGICLGGCLAVCTPLFLCPPVTSRNSGPLEAPRRHFLTIYVLVPQAGGGRSLANLAHACPAASQKAAAPALSVRTSH